MCFVRVVHKSVGGGEIDGGEYGRWGETVF
jgi:hypothetical protein